MTTLEIATFLGYELTNMSMGYSFPLGCTFYKNQLNDDDVTWLTDYDIHGDEERPMSDFDLRKKGILLIWRVVRVNGKKAVSNMYFNSEIEGEYLINIHRECVNNIDIMLKNMGA